MMFVEMARPIPEPSEPNGIERARYAKILKDVAAACSWIGDQSYMAELFRYKEDKDPVIHIDRRDAKMQ